MKDGQPNNGHNVLRSGRQRRRARTVVSIGLGIWALLITIGVLLSLDSGWARENFGIIFMGLAAFCPDFLGAEEYNKPLFYGWSVAAGFVFALLAGFGWSRENQRVAWAFLLSTVASLVVGVWRMLAHLSTIH